MTDQQTRTPYSVRIDTPDAIAGPLTFTYSPTKPNGRTVRHAVEVRREPGGLSFDWDSSPDAPGDTREEIEADIAERMRDREAWIRLATDLVGQVEAWGRELGRATRRIEKGLDDDWIGRHRVPALHLQDDLCRVLLEPLGPSAPGVQGVVDLYLMPACDDIARLSYAGDRWEVYDMSPGATLTGSVGDPPLVPFSKEVLADILSGMKRHAA